MVVCLITDEIIHALEIDARQREVLSRGRATVNVQNSLLQDHNEISFASQIKRAVDACKAGVTSIRLVVPSNWCFCHMIPFDSKRTTIQAMEYELEQYLPIPIEEVTCAFGRTTKNEMLAVAIPTRPMRRLLDGCREQGLDVTSISVDALVAHSSEEASVAIVDRRWMRAGAKANRKAQVNTSLADKRYYEVILNGSESVRILNVGGQELPEHLKNRTAVVHDEAESLARLALAVNNEGIDLASRGLASSQQSKSMERKQHRCLIVTALLLVTLNLGTLWHGFRVDLDSIRREQEKVYVTVFGASRMPPGGAMKLASERIRLEGLTRQSESGQRLDSGQNPLSSFRSFVRALPSNVRIRLENAKITRSRLSLCGATSEHRDAERIVNAANSVPGFQSGAPRTTRRAEGGVDFVVRASYKNE